MINECIVEVPRNIPIEQLIKLSNAASVFSSEIKLTVGNRMVNVKSIMGLLTTVITSKTKCFKLVAIGDDSKLAVTSLSRLLQSENDYDLNSWEQEAVEEIKSLLDRPELKKTPDHMFNAYRAYFKY